MVFIKALFALSISITCFHNTLYYNTYLNAHSRLFRLNRRECYLFWCCCWQTITWCFSYEDVSLYTTPPPPNTNVPEKTVLYRNLDILKPNIIFEIYLFGTFVWIYPPPPYTKNNKVTTSWKPDWLARVLQSEQAYICRCQLSV